MAGAILAHLSGGRIHVESCGVRAGTLDGFTLAVMNEIGIDLSGFESKDFEHLPDMVFDLVVSLTPEAHHHALDLMGSKARESVYWPTFDPTAVWGSREQILGAYRDVRDDLMRRIESRFELRPTPNP